jgi:hypothetical protein
MFGLFTKKDKVVDSLIRPPRVVFSGFDWKRDTDKLVPNGDATKESAVAHKFGGVFREKETA